MARVWYSTVTFISGSLLLTRDATPSLDLVFKTKMGAQAMVASPRLPLSPFTSQVASFPLPSGNISLATCSFLQTKHLP